MRTKILIGQAIVITILTVVAMVLFYFVSQNTTDSDPSLVTETAAGLPEQVSYGLPIRLKIPAIEVDADVEYVGLTADGAMDVPTNPDNVAWYQLGPRSGENGNAVMAGHYGIWKDGQGSAFDQLHTLQTGDAIYVEDDGGIVTEFVVRDSRSYDPEADATDVFITNDGLPHLNLITCEGDWDSVTQNYSSRLVIFADKI